MLDIALEDILMETNIANYDTTHIKIEVANFTEFVDKNKAIEILLLMSGKLDELAHAIADTKEQK